MAAAFDGSEAVPPLDLESGCHEIRDRDQYVIELHRWAI
jgi:hypothetical protein